MTLELAALIGKVDAQMATEEDHLFIRFLTPLVKLFTAKEAVRVCSEGIECFGGQGYMENSRIPVIFRDVQVTPIWEGTTNILSLDFMKVVMKSPRLVPIFGKRLKAILNSMDPDQQ